MNRVRLLTQICKNTERFLCVTFPR